MTSPTDSASNSHLKSTRRGRPLVFALAACWAILSIVALAADEPSRPKSFAIQGAKLIPVSGPVIEAGTIVFEDGLITAIGRDIQIPPGTLGH